MEYIDKATLALKHIVSKEKSRYALNGINIEKGRAVACDGRMAAIVKAPRDGNGFDGEKSAIIGGDLLKKIEKNMPKVGYAELETTKKGVEITIPEGPDTMVIKAKPLAGYFPEIDSIWPKGSPKVTIQLNIDMLMCLAKVAEAGGVNRNLILEIFDSESAILVKSSSNDRFEGMILPITIQ